MKSVKIGLKLAFFKRQEFKTSILEGSPKQGFLGSKLGVKSHPESIRKQGSFLGSLWAPDCPLFKPGFIGF